MSLIDKIFGSSSFKKNKSKTFSSSGSTSIPVPGRHSKESPKYPHDDDEDDDDTSTANVLSKTIRSDPVPRSFRNNASFPAAPGGLAINASCSYDSSSFGASGATPLSPPRMNGSFVASHHRHQVSSPSHFTAASAPSYHHRGGGGGGMAAASGTRVSNHSIAGLAKNGSIAGVPEMQQGGVNYWRLPWGKQKVHMCTYCQRPIRPKDAGMQGAHMSSRELTGHPEKFEGSDLSDDREDDGLYDGGARDGFEDSDSDTDLAGVVTETRCYCHCGMNDDVSLPEVPSGRGANEDASDAIPVAPPVFIVETQRSANIAISGTLAEANDASGSDGSDHDEDGTGVRRNQPRTTKLSLVSPLLSSTLRTRQQNTSGSRIDDQFAPIEHPPGARVGSIKQQQQQRRHRDCAVSSWLHEQQHEGNAYSSVSGIQ